jgi:thiamine thiazole synthase
VIVREDGRVAGVVVNHGAVPHLPREVRAIDPLCLEASNVIDATGHDAVVVAALARRGMAQRTGEGAMWAEVSEGEVVARTGWIHPGLLVCGMSVAATFGLHRMGPTFGAMLLSGQEVARALLADTPEQATATGEVVP